MKGLLIAVAGARWLRTSVFYSYRPELHYMRGPGPKYHLRHPAGADDSSDGRRNQDEPAGYELLTRIPVDVDRSPRHARA